MTRPRRTYPKLGAAIGFLLLLALGASAAKAQDCGPDKLGVHREIPIDGKDGVSVGLQSYPQSLELSDHEVVLTFDDGPASPTTTETLDALKAECVHATFFLIGRNAAALPELVKRELKEGHSVGYHSMTHPARTLRMMPFEAGKKEVDDGVAAVDAAASRLGSAPAAPFFRFPGYADSKELLDYVHSRGMNVFGSDLWASDWLLMTPQAELSLVMGRLEKAGKGVILFHDSKASTAKMLPDFLRELKTRGFKVVHMVAGPGPTPVTAQKPGWTSTTEPIIRKTLKIYEKPEQPKEARPEAPQGETPKEP